MDDWRESNWQLKKCCLRWFFFYGCQIFESVYMSIDEIFNSQFHSSSGNHSHLSRFASLTTPFKCRKRKREKNRKRNKNVRLFDSSLRCVLHTKHDGIHHINVYTKCFMQWKLKNKIWRKKTTFYVKWNELSNESKSITL